MKRNIIVHDKNCIICNEKEWIGLKNNSKYLLLIGTSNAAEILSQNYKYIFGVKWKKAEICIKCFEILVGLENHYNKYWQDLIENEEAKKIVSKIISNSELFEKSLKLRSKGKYISNEIIQNALSLK